ncbi:MAG: Gfo/Idh/MocA family oxidoreductase [Chloroflexi bacterium]|nr:Gfo/Idh/MocA family oxidoreductase [Chloroflexota bacterium]
MKKLRTGILGCGGIAQKHAQAARALNDEIELVAFCDHTEFKARAFAVQYAAGRAKTFTDYRVMLDQVDLDLLVVCLPPFAHRDEVELAAARGVHLLVEKPIALTSAHAWRMVDAAERVGIKTQVGFMYRFGAAVTHLKKQLARGEIGDPGLFSARYFCNALHAPWWRAREKSGGQLVEQAIHLFDVMRYLLGEPTMVYGRQANVFHRDLVDYTIEDVSATVCSFANGALGVIYATNGALPGVWIKEWRVVTQNLVAEFADWNNATFTRSDMQPLETERIVSAQDVFALQLRDLVNAIRTNSATRTPLREGAKSLDLVLTAARSAETHSEIKLDADSSARG